MKNKTFLFLLLISGIVLFFLLHSLHRIYLLGNMSDTSRPKGEALRYASKNEKLLNSGFASANIEEIEKEKRKIHSLPDDALIHLLQTESDAIAIDGVPVLSIVIDELANRGTVTAISALNEVAQNKPKYFLNSSKAKLAIVLIQNHQKTPDERLNKLVELFSDPDQYVANYLLPYLFKNYSEEKLFPFLEKYKEKNVMAEMGYLKIRIKKSSSVDKAKFLIKELTKNVEKELNVTAPYSLLIDLGRGRSYIFPDIQSNDSDLKAAIKNELLLAINHVEKVETSSKNKGGKIKYLVLALNAIGDSSVINKLTPEQKNYIYQEEQIRNKKLEDSKAQVDNLLKHNMKTK